MPSRPISTRPQLDVTRLSTVSVAASTRIQQLAGLSSAIDTALPGMVPPLYLMPAASVAPGTPVGPEFVPATGMDVFDLAQPFKAKVPPTPAEVVGFFDRVHGQTAVAPDNGIEPHPILSIAWR